VDAAREEAERLGLPIGPAVDFWTEASLFAERGLPAIVFGPGHIREAHTPGEWVELSQIETALGAYRRILTTA
jgi:acetylornithine deacetylase